MYEWAAGELGQLWLLCMGAGVDWNCYAGGVESRGKVMGGHVEVSL